MTTQDASRAALISAAKVMEGLAKEKLADVREMHDQELRCQIAIQTLEEEIAGLKVKRRTESGMARFLYDQANILRQQASGMKAANPWIEQAEAILVDKGVAHDYRLENSSEKPQLLSFDLIPAGEDVKIATIISHLPSGGTSKDGERLFSVAGYRTQNGSPNAPFAGLSAALDCALAMERWDPEKHTMFPVHPINTPGVNALGQTVPAGDAEGRL